jgi:uncharacterized protein YjbI with pentapeptide repeats
MEFVDELLRDEQEGRGLMASARSPRPPRVDASELRAVSSILSGELDLFQARLTCDHAGLAGGGEMAEVVAEGASLAQSRLDPLHLTDVVLRRTDLSNASWAGMTARRLMVSGCRTVGWRVICDFAEELVVEECRWEHGGLHLGRSRGGVVFRGCTFAGTSLRGDFSRMVFDGCDFAGAEFAVSAAARCDLRTSDLEGARGLTTLRGARIRSEQAMGIADLLAVEAGFLLDGD